MMSQWLFNLFGQGGLGSKCEGLEARDGFAVCWRLGDMGGKSVLVTWH